MIKKNFNQPLSPIVFHILLSLSKRERHGYEIMKQVGYESRGVINLGPGSLYGTLKRLLEECLVEEAAERPDQVIDDRRRRYYRLTEEGYLLLGGEIERLSQILSIARKNLGFARVGGLA